MNKRRETWQQPETSTFEAVGVIVTAGLLGALVDAVFIFTFWAAIHG